MPRVRPFFNPPLLSHLLTRRPPPSTLFPYTTLFRSGLTTKTLYELDGGHTVEAVVMRYSERSTLCISSQAGCPVGCPFCATGKFPFGRNLAAHEIEEQAIASARLLADEGRRLSHVVFM